ncbi:hypothetical protein K450DRAFT_245307 [Umbelopsis ramanniana AG]|uniref:Uncharacterized protein n=1 Tax=Umbelopsis ramanniana AG TaxID=1314678 RepID=A0AAD5HE27_UMBRA|nr:uncharacterized protein K450DRAFT_245307 [Umbelopsis ramanniana AG]KAI8578748.1 hypothetical protein K450DRAFT_245307 [Umbelopsis ramanniana AG]
MLVRFFTTWIDFPPIFEIIFIEYGCQHRVILDHTIFFFLIFFYCTTFRLPLIIMAQYANFLFFHITWRLGCCFYNKVLAVLTATGTFLVWS